MSGIGRLNKEIADNYGRDLGNLELLLEALHSQKPLNVFKVFKDYPYLYGTRLYSRLDGIDLIYEGSVDMSYLVSESVAINDLDTIDQIEEDRKDVKVVKNLVYPTQGVFRNDFFGYLAEVIQSTESGESNERH
jgi:hypothetical protein